jgi:hypothetical protein
MKVGEKEQQIKNTLRNILELNIGISFQYRFYIHFFVLLQQSEI